MRRLRLVFFGLPLAAILLAKDGHSVELAAVCRKDALGLRRLRRTLGPDRVLVKPRADDPALLARVRELAPDLVVSWFWTTRLPMQIIRAASQGGLGVHPSLLPRHRGPDPTFWAIDSGDTETGATVHRIEREYDTGATLGQERLAIDPAWNAWLLARALDRPSLRLLRATVATFARGERPTETPQDSSLATAAPSPSDEEAAIRWTWSTERILRRIRALAPAPGAWTELGGACVTVLRAEEARMFPSAMVPGEGCMLAGDAVVRTGDSAIVLRALEINGRPADRGEVEALFAPHADIA